MNYYGVRYGKGCHPTDLFVTYFTSSDYVTDYIKEHGMPDIVEVRKIFTGKDRRRKATLHESKVLKRMNVLFREDYLNKNDGSLQMNWDDPELKERHRQGLVRAHSRPEVKEANSKAQKIAQNKPEQKQKLSETSAARWADEEFKSTMVQKHIDLWKDEDHRKKQVAKRIEVMNRPEERAANSARNTGAGNARYDHKLYRFEHVDGRVEISTRYDLSVKYGLKSPGMCGIVKGIGTGAKYHGWTCMEIVQHSLEGG
jgi:hypothetical protein